MKKEIKSILVLAITTFFFACDNSDTSDKNHVIIKIKDENGNLVSESSYLLDTPITDGITKNFNPDGSLNNIVNYVRGRKEGPASFFRNGEKLKECDYTNGIETGNFMLYNKGNLIQYAFLDKLGNTRYTIDYNENGKIIKKDGKFFYLLYNSKDTNDDKYSYIVHSAKPPKTIVKFNVCEENGSCKDYILKSNEFAVNAYVSKNNNLFVSGIIIDSLNQTVIDSCKISKSIP
ncbi:MAG: hypothetical protein Q8M15_05830 [Bacteroidota bacterium]|nr:hypothetical protein [Bacteroidota bacterium]